MKRNLVLEIKNFNLLILKELFFMKKGNFHNNHPSPLQIQIIEFLQENKSKEIYQKDLETRFSVSKAAISEVLRTMERKGIVKRIQSSRDARKNKIVLSAGSNKIYKEMQEDLEKLNGELTSKITPEELETFLSVLDKMCENIGKRDKNV